MSPPVTQEDVGLGILVIGGGICLIWGLFTLLSALSDITPSMRADDAGCGFWLAVIGIGLLGLALLGYLL